MTTMSTQHSEAQFSLPTRIEELHKTEQGALTETTTERRSIETLSTPIELRKLTIEAEAGTSQNKRIQETTIKPDDLTLQREPLKMLQLTHTIILTMLLRNDLERLSTSKPTTRKSQELQSMSMLTTSDQELLCTNARKESTTTLRNTFRTTIPTSQEPSTSTPEQTEEETSSSEPTIT